ncbi:DUF7662 domain-containing protein [Parasphingopyxis marina]|uniref:DUF7662 domain-containing protein n=1 Tax=Parasphingopyxis marina TaxID=2761622 RepID=A0A842HYC3_9SPHN|nr:hypothetical protein [Parasphingopyxis marina]MBC2776920.1 hypothetical protein [Parasphingopyxis marina]
MSKYAPLTRFLADYEDNEVELSFNQIGDMIDGDLPDSAYSHRPWWANRTDGQGSQNLAWQGVGWETTNVDMSRELVRFVRKCEASADEATIQPLSIAQAKSGLAKQFGVPVDCIEVHIRG